MHANVDTVTLSWLVKIRDQNRVKVNVISNICAFPAVTAQTAVKQLWGEEVFTLIIEV